MAHERTPETFLCMMIFTLAPYGLHFRKPFRNAARKTTEFILPQLSVSPTNPPQLMLVSLSQQLRKTRPPVPPSQLTHIPYSPSCPRSCTHGTARCLSLSPSTLSPQSEVRRHRKRKRRRGRSTLLISTRDSEARVNLKSSDGGLFDWSDYDLLQHRT
jgi:hypothetical protein